jgi:Polysaccharide biosynthesis/export protein/SLBB domain
LSEHISRIFFGLSRRHWPRNIERRRNKPSKLPFTLSVYLSPTCHGRNTSRHVRTIWVARAQLEELSKLAGDKNERKDYSNLNGGGRDIADGLLLDLWAGMPAESGGYRLEPGDALRVTMFRHEDLSGEFTLDAQGNFSLPPVGEIRGGGQTARQLEVELEAALTSGGYLEVSIEVLNYRPFYVIGEVNVSGSFEYIHGMTVITALTLAGGFTDRAYQDGVAIERSGKECRAKPSTPLVPDDIIRVPERLFWAPFLNPGGYNRHSRPVSAAVAP